MLLAHTTCAIDVAACALFARLEALLDPYALAGTNFPADATACAVFERLGPLLDPGSLAGTNFPTDATAFAVTECPGLLLDPGSFPSTNCPADATACVVMTRPTMFHVQQSCDSSSLESVSPKAPGACAALKRRILLLAYEVIQLDMAVKADNSRSRRLRIDDFIEDE